jgi:hypothetical protein
MAQQSNDLDRQDPGKQRGQNTEDSQARGSGNLENVSSDRDAADSNEGGLTGSRDSESRGSGTTTKNTVTGSDFDGQAV